MIYVDLSDYDDIIRKKNEIIYLIDRSTVYELSDRKLTKEDIPTLIDNITIMTSYEYYMNELEHEYSYRVTIRDLWNDESLNIDEFNETKDLLDLEDYPRIDEDGEEDYDAPYRFRITFEVKSHRFIDIKVMEKSEWEEKYPKMSYQLFRDYFYAYIAEVDGNQGIEDDYYYKFICAYYLYECFEWDEKENEGDIIDLMEKQMKEFKKNT